MEALPWTLDDVSEGLLALRTDAGSPSYTEISRRVTADRTARGLPLSECHVARATVHHAFQTGRRRISEELLSDIVRALGAGPTVTDHWVRVSRAAQRRLGASSVVSVHDRLPDLTSPSVDRVVASETLDLIRSGAKLIVLEGMPGSGKTQLALQVARQVLDHGDVTGVLHVDLRGYHAEQPPVDPIAAVDAAVRVMGRGPGPGSADEATRQRLYASLLAEDPRVIVLDDAADAVQVRPLLPVAGRSVVLVTSRTALELPGARRVIVPGYTVAESTALLAAVAGRDRVEAEPQATRELLDATAHLPLSVSLAASRVASRPDWTLADHVALINQRLSSLRLDEPLHANLTRSYVSLSQPGQDALRLLAAQPFPALDRLDVAPLLGVGREDSEAVLAELTTHHLVTPHGDSSVRLHPLVQTFGLDQSMEEDPPAARIQAVARLADHFVSLAWADHLHQRTHAPRPVPPGIALTSMAVEPVHAWLESSTENLLLLAANAREWALADRVFPLAAALAYWLNVSGRYREGVELHELALTEATRAGDEAAQLIAHLDLGMSMVRLDDWEGATTHLVPAHAGFEEAGRTSEAREALNALAIRDAQQGRNEEAASKFTHCAELARDAGELAGLGSALDNSAIVLRRLHRYDEALAHHERAVEVARECANVALEARSLINAAALLISLDRPEEALASASAGLRLAQEHGVLPVTGYGKENLASALRLLGRPEEAAEQHRAALRIADGLGDAHLRLAALIGLGEDLLMWNPTDPTEAADHFRQGLVLAVDLGEPLDRVRAWHGLAVTAAASDDLAAAAQWRHRSDEYVADLAPHEQDLVGDWLARQGG